MTEMPQSERALSEVIGVITLVGLITVVLAVYLAYSVPADGRENEIKQMNGIKDSFTEYKTALDSLWINAPANPAGLTGTYGITTETNIVLGTASASKDFVSLFPLLNPVGSFGSIRVNGNDGSVRIIKNGDEELLNISIGSMRYQSSNNYWVQQEYIYQMGGVFLSQGSAVINKISPTFTVYNKSNKAAISITPINVTGSNYVTGGGSITADSNLLPVLPYYSSTIGAETIRIEMELANLVEAEAWENVFRDSAYMNNFPSGWYSTGSSGDESSGTAYIEVTGPSTGEDVDVAIDITRADFLTTIRGALPSADTTGTATSTTATTATPTQGTPPTADFSGSPTSGTRPLAVAFTDLSTENPTTWAWTFGDGNTSNAQNPSHTYASPGTYTVSLTATNAFGSDTKTKTGYITVSEQPPVANFSGSPTSGTRPLAVTFTDLSTHSPTEWAWDFGDGNTSDQQNPTHTYASPGTYTVSLNATNSGGSDTETKTGYIIVTEIPPVADFSANTTSGTIPLAVAFTDLSTHSPTEWTWSFGDGGTSTEQNPSYTYTSAGTYTVSLTATNSGGSDTETKIDYITVAEPTPHDILLNSYRSGSSLRDGGYLEFTVTANSNIYIDGTRYRLSRNDVVRLTINSDTGGSIYGSNGRITTFSYTDVTLSINGVERGTGAVTSIYISDSSDYSSTLVLDVPAADPEVWTQFQVDGTNLIYGSDGRSFVFSEIVPRDSDRILQLTSGGSYFRFRSIYTTDPPI